MDKFCNIWKVSSVTISDEGESLEIRFKKKQGIGSQTITMNVDAWVEGLHARWRLERFEKALKQATDILSGDL